MPLPRTALFPTLALAILLAVPPTLAGPAVPEPITGEGTVTAFRVRSHDVSHDFEGGVADYTLACTSCTLNLTVASAGFTAVQNGAPVDLAPGVYHVREFSGVFSWTMVELGNYTVTLTGAGQVHRIG